MTIQPIAFASSNPEKYAIAQHVCGQAGLQVEQILLEVDEIQGENPELIIADKAKRAYEHYGKPLIVSDDSWDIPALGGFPGPYMKSMNQWFTADDFLRLTHDLKDRTILLNQFLAYYDGTELTIFSNTIAGVILTKQQGESVKNPSMSITALDHDNGLSVAEVFTNGPEFIANRYKTRPDAWHEFVGWYKEKHS